MEQKEMKNKEEYTYSFKPVRTLTLYYEYFIYPILGFFMGQAEMFFGFHLFSVIYLLFFLETPKLFIINIVGVTLGLLWQGEIFNLVYPAGIILGIFVCKLIFKVSNKKNSVILALSISGSLLILALFLNEYRGLLLYHQLMSTGEAVLLFFLILLIKNSVIEKGMNEYSNLNIILLSSVFAILLGIVSFFSYEKIIIETILIIFVAYFANYRGIHWGVFLAGIYSVLFYFTGHIPQMSIVKIIIFAVMGGIFPSFRKVFLLGGLGLAFFVFSGLVSSMYELQITAGETLIAAIVMLIIPLKYGQKYMDYFYYSPDNLIKTSKYSHSHYYQFFEQRIKELSLVFSELSTTFSEVIPESEDEQYKRKEDYIFLFKQNNCQKCSKRIYCWQNNTRNTKRGLFETLNLIEKNGLKSLPGKTILNNCPDLKRVILGAGNSYNLYQLNNFWREKIIDKQKVITEQLKGVGDLLCNFSLHQDLEINYELVFRNIRNKMIINELEVYDIKLYPDFNSGKVNLYLNIEPCTGNEPCSFQIPGLIQSEFNKRFRLINKKCGNRLKDKPCYIKYGECGKFKLESSFKQFSYQKVCGDSFLYNKLGNGQDLVALSDGMGTGESAAKESRAAIRLLQRIISAGFEQELAVDIINSALFLRNQKENFTTLDILFFNTFTGEAIFNKIGSVSSFIKRGSKIFEIKPSSIPVGILKDIKSTFVKRQLQKDDIVIMISDGVLETLSSANNNEKSFLRLLQGVAIDDPDTLSEFIKDKLFADSAIFDDITIIILKVKEIRKKSRKITF
ncbi:MAG: SpoIIE family protein phosphatase [Bacillota bacterium]